MHKKEFVDYIAKQHDVTKVEADRIIGIFVSSIIGVLSKGDEVNLIGFGGFYTSPVAAREGRNPKTGASLKIEAYVQPRFAAGSKLKAACNGKGDSGEAKKAVGADKLGKKPVAKKTGKK